MTTVEGWKTKKLTDLADYVNGAAFGPDDWGKEGLPIVRIEQLKNPAAPTDHYAGNLPAKNLIDNGDLVFSWSASLFLKIWRNGPAALNQHLFKVLEKPGVDRKFLKFFIEFHLDEITKASHGSTMQHITRKELDRFSAPFPEDVQEQTQIVGILFRIDKAIEQTEAIIAKQQRIKTGLMQNLLTRGIDEHGHIRSEATHAFKDSPLGRVPAEWAVESVGMNLAKSPRNGYSPQESEAWTGTMMLGLGCLTPDGFRPIQLKYAPPTQKQIEKALLSEGDFLISRSNTRDLVGLIGIYRDIGEPCIYSDLMVRLAFNDDVDTRFMEHMFRSEKIRLQLQSAATGTSGSMVKINARIIRNILFQKPGHDEQLRILGVIEKHQQSLNGWREQLSKSSALKRALMQDLLAGKVRVTPLLEAGA